MFYFFVELTFCCCCIIHNYCPFSLSIYQIHFHNHLLSATCSSKLRLAPSLCIRRPGSINHALSVACSLKLSVTPTLCFRRLGSQSGRPRGKDRLWEYDGFENNDDSCHHSPLSKKIKEVTKNMFPRQDLKQQRETVHQQKPCTRLLPA